MRGRIQTWKAEREHEDVADVGGERGERKGKGGRKNKCQTTMDLLICAKQQEGRKKR